MEGDRDSLQELLEIDRATMTRDQILDHLGTVRVALARLSASLERDIAAVSDPDDEKNWDREEIGCAMGWGYRFTQARIVQAHKLVDALPATLAALGDGQINPEHARAAAEACYGFDRGMCAKVEAEVLARAGAQTVTQFTRALTRAIHRADPAAAELRHRRAKKYDKGVWVRPLADGLSGIWSVHDAVTAAAVYNAVQAAASGRPAPDDARDADERRADTLAALILGSDRDGGSSRRVRVNILVPFDVARGVSDLPAELVGYGPIPASLCREVMAESDSEWRRFVIGPLGELLDCSTRRFPSDALRERIVARDRTCRMPGCNRRAGTCEIDHVTDWNGHNTVENNLHALCPRHHHLKHETGWQLERSEDGATVMDQPGRPTLCRASRSVAGGCAPGRPGSAALIR